MAYRPRGPVHVDDNIINTKGHIFVGAEWSVIGSKGDHYIVTMADKGFTCSCMAFERRGMLCKHINAVVAGIVGE